MVKDVKIYVYGLKKRLVWGDFRIEKRYVTITMKTGLKEGRRNRNVNYSAFPYTRCTLSFAFEYLPAYNSTLHLLYNLTLDPIVEYFKRYLSLSTANLLTQLGGKSNTCSCSSPTPYSASTSPPSLPSPPPVVV